MAKKAKKKSPKKAARYTPEKKAEIVSFVREYNKKNGRGGQSKAANKFGASMLSISKWLKEIPEEESKKTVKKKTAKKAKKKTSLKSPEKSKSKKEKVQTAPPPAVSDSVSYEILSVESAGFCSFCEREKDKKNPYSRVIRLTGKGSKENFQVNICRPCITKVHILEVRAQA